jgi:hypothetical protein
MLITGNTFNGANIIALPSDVSPKVRGPRSIEWDRREFVASNESPFTGQTQQYDWMQSLWVGQVSFPPMDRFSRDCWVSFLSLCRGSLNVFQLGDPKGKKPKGVASLKPGAPVVNGANQTGYSLATRGWTASISGMLQPGDYVQVGYRLYVVNDVVSTDGSGHATLPVWPPVRDLPADGAQVITYNCRGLFRLAKSSGNKDSVNVGSYGLNAIDIVEAL